MSLKNVNTSLLMLVAVLAVVAVLVSPLTAISATEVGNIHKVEAVEAIAKTRGDNGEIITLPASMKLTFEVTDVFRSYTTTKLVEGYVEIDGKRYIMSEGWAVALSREGVKAVGEGWGPNGSSHLLIRANDTEVGEEGTYMNFKAGFKCEGGKYLIAGTLLRYKVETE